MSVVPTMPPGRWRNLSARIRLREMRREDLRSVVLNEQEAYVFSWSEGIFLDCLHAGCPCWVFENSDEEIIGHAIVLLNQAVAEAHLLNLTVAPAEQGNGVGRQAMEFLLCWLPTQGIEQLLLEVRPSNTAACRLYQALGFEKIGQRKGYYPALNGREDAWVMSRSLDLEWRAVVESPLQ